MSTSFVDLLLELGEYLRKEPTMKNPHYKGQQNSNATTPNAISAQIDYFLSEELCGMMGVQARSQKRQFDKLSGHIGRSTEEVSLRLAINDIQKLHTFASS